MAPAIQVDPGEEGGPGPVGRGAGGDDPARPRRSGSTSSASGAPVPRPDPVAIVAAGVVTPVGQDLDAFWSGLLAGADGISPIERVPVRTCACRGGEIKKLPLGLARRCRTPGTRLLVSRRGRSRRAARGSTSTPRARGRGRDRARRRRGGRARSGGDGAARRAARRALRRPAPQPGALARGGRARDHRVDGVRLRRHRAGARRRPPSSGEADAVVAGGYDVLCRFVMRGFDALRSLTRDDVRPFDRRRSGLLLGEAAALVLLPRARRAGPAARHAARLWQRERRLPHLGAGSRGPRARARGLAAASARRGWRPPTSSS